MNAWAFVNNQFIEEKNAALHFRDLAIQRGYGVFEFFRVMNSLPVFIRDHLDRLYFSAGQMHLSIPHSREELMSCIRELIEKNKVVNSGIRITVTGGYSTDGYQLAEPNLIMAEQQFQAPPKEQFEQGIKLVTHEHQRQLPDVKTIDYLMAIRLQPYIREKQAADVLYHQNGRVTECPRANFFALLQDNKLVTPANNVLKGITRMKLIQMAKEYLPVEERDLQLDELQNAKEVFISSTTKMVLPVSQIDAIKIPESGNTIARKLSDLLTQLQVASSAKLA